MAQIPTNEADFQRVHWIAKELGISLEDAAVTYAGYDRAFSDESLRREIFEMIDRLDDEAYKKGEPMGLIISYTVELEREGIRVGRYADHIPPGEVVHLTPTDRAMIFLRINDNFPTQQFLGPIIMNRPEWKFESELCPAESEIQNPRSKIDNGVVCPDESQFPDPKSQIEQQDDLISDVKHPSLDEEGCPVADGLTSDVKLPSLDKEGCPVGRGGLTDTENYNTDIPNNTSPSRPSGVVILLGPIRLKLDERFPCLSAAATTAQRTVAKPLASAARTSRARPLLAAAASQPGQPTSGLSPPLNAENLGHSKIERCPDGPRQ